MNTTGWLKGLQVTADGTGTCRTRGVALVRALADNTGLTAGLSKALASNQLLVDDRAGCWPTWPTQSRTATTRPRQRTWTMRWTCTAAWVTVSAKPKPFSRLGVLQRSTGDYTAAEATSPQALEIFRDLGDRPYLAWILNDLGMVQQLTRDYQAAASHQRALELFRDLGNRLGQAEALNKLGELATQTHATSQARDQHTQALAIARDLGAPREEARALEGIGNSHLHDGNPSTPRSTYSRHWPSTSASAPPPPSASRKPSNGTRCLPPPRSPDQSRPAAKAIQRPLPPRPKQAVNQATVCGCAPAASTTE